MKKHKMDLFPKLQLVVEQLLEVNDERRVILQALIDYIQEKKNNEEEVSSLKFGHKQQQIFMESLHNVFLGEWRLLLLMNEL